MGHFISLRRDSTSSNILSYDLHTMPTHTHEPTSYKHPVFVPKLFDNTASWWWKYFAVDYFTHFFSFLQNLRPLRTFSGFGRKSVLLRDYFTVFWCLGILWNDRLCVVCGIIKLLFICKGIWLHSSLLCYMNLLGLNRTDKTGNETDKLSAVAPNADLLRMTNKKWRREFEFVVGKFESWGVEMHESCGVGNLLCL